MSPQLYEAINAKLLRVSTYIIVDLFAAAQRNSGEPWAIWRAHMDVERCRRELRYEYLGLKDSWL